MCSASKQKMSFHPPTPSSAGFTMIEVLIALAVFSIGILAVFAMQTTAINQNAAARMQSEATAVATQTMERLAVAPYDHDDLSAAPEDNPHQQTIGSYLIEWWVVTPPTPPLNNSVYNDVPVKAITLTVDSANPHARPVTLSFIKGQGL